MYKIYPLHTNCHWMLDSYSVASGREGEFLTWVRIWRGNLLHISYLDKRKDLKLKILRDLNNYLHYFIATSGNDYSSHVCALLNFKQARMNFRKYSSETTNFALKKIIIIFFPIP
jgi:hypothetical protein